jgi:hypothetical protein
MFGKILQFLGHRYGIRGRHLADGFSGGAIDDLEVGDSGRLIHFELKARIRLLELGVHASGCAAWAAARAGTALVALELGFFDTAAVMAADGSITGDPEPKLAKGLT